MPLFAHAVPVLAQASENVVLAFVCFVLSVYYFILIARLILSWFPQIPEAIRPIVDVIYALTEPVLGLARPLIPPVRIGMAALDLSVLLVFFLLWLIQTALCS